MYSHLLNTIYNSDEETLTFSESIYKARVEALEAYLQRLSTDERECFIKELKKKMA